MATPFFCPAAAAPADPDNGYHPMGGNGEANNTKRCEGKGDSPTEALELQAISEAVPVRVPVRAGHWDLPSPEVAPMGPDAADQFLFGLLATGRSQVAAGQVVVQQSGLHKWIKKLDGSIALAAKPSLVLAVEGDLGSGNARIVVASHGRLEHSQELGLSVAYGKFEAGAAVVLSNVSVLADHNKFRLNVAWWAMGES
eukprot:Skav226230  [mRNA]  locus=scaffold1218:340302:344597:- [translate_table: standard]